MEVDKKKNNNNNKRRVTREEEENEGVKKRLKGEEEEEDNGSDGVPTEEEVEEFFAILRRMRVAIKYFDDKGRGGRDWREQIETAELAVLHDGDVATLQENHMPEKNGGGQPIINEGFDLNAVAPEAAEGGGT